MFLTALSLALSDRNTVVSRSRCEALDFQYTRNSYSGESI